MKVLTNSEVRQIVVDLQTLVGSQLQEVGQSGDHFYLGFYHEREMVYLWFDMDPRAPMLVLCQQKPFKKLKDVKPLMQFAKAHFVGHRLMSVHTLPSWGRVLQLRFHSPEDAGLHFEARLFPHGQNLIFTKIEESKKGKIKTRPVSLFQVVDLEAAPEVERNEDWQSNLEPRTWQEISDQYKREKFSVSARAQGPVSPLPASNSQESSRTEISKDEREFLKLVRKKSQAIEKMQIDLSQKVNASYLEAGEWLKAHLYEQDGSEVPAQFQEIVDAKKSWKENVQLLFAKAKTQKAKVAAATARLAAVQAELNRLEKNGWQAWANSVAKAKLQRQSGGATGSARESLLHKVEARGRTLTFSPQVQVYVGRNAGENLKLLRAAQPHDLWMHLRDQPSSHAILRRPKGHPVSDNEIQEIGRWVIEQSLRRSPALLSGQMFELILVECRYVRPIKGDKAGRVTYTQDRCVRVKFS